MIQEVGSVPGTVQILTDPGGPKHTDRTLKVPIPNFKRIDVVTFNSKNVLQITVVFLQCSFEVEMNQINLVLVPAKVGQILIHCPLLD